jgi:DNA-binding transcriptional MocR family regulator
MDNGWVCLHRKMTKWEWYQNNNVKAVYLHCLLMANWEDKRWQGKIIHRGEFVTSLSHMANDLGMSVDIVRYALKKLEDSGEITKTSTNRFTLIKCCNYSLYQDIDIAISQTNPKQKPNESQSNPNQIPTTNNNNKNNNKNNYNKKQRLKCEIGFDIDEIKRKAILNDDFDI